MCVPMRMKAGGASWRRTLRRRPLVHLPELIPFILLSFLAKSRTREFQTPSLFNLGPHYRIIFFHQKIC